MIRRDMPEVMDIEEKSFDDPLREEDFLRMMRRPPTIGMVLELNEEVVGWVIYSLHRHHYTLDRMAIRPDLRRLGCGQMVTKMLKRKCEPSRRGGIIVEVDDANLGFHLFLKSQGFRATLPITDNTYTFIWNKTCPTK
jgi:ribosomal-protein-alanine N-acetyltransferase